MADKGKATVVMYDDCYKQEMKTLLSDTNSYMKIDYDALPFLQTNFKDMMQFWNTKRYLDQVCKKNYLAQTDTMLPEIYGYRKFIRLMHLLGQLFP